MPGPAITRTSLYPDWTPPETASVFDPATRAPIRTLIRWLGLDDPQQIMAVGTPLEIGPMRGGAIAALAARFPRFAQALAQVTQDLPKPLGSLAKTLNRTVDRGVYELKPSVQGRLASFYELGGRQPNLANWAGVTEELTQAFGGDRDASRTWARLWGATSPNTSVPRNTQESLTAWLYALRTQGAPLTVPQAQALTPQPITMAPSKVPNINRALAGQPLSGDKVEAMAGFMVGDPRIPIDVHALYGLGSEAEKLSPELPALRAYMTKAETLPARGGLTDTEIYLRYERALRETLDVFHPQTDVNSIFAQTWEGIRAGKGLAPQGGPIDILRKKGLLAPGAMLDPDRLTSALKTAGWTAGSIAALLTAIDQYAPAPPASAPEGDARAPYGPVAPPATLPDPTRPR